MAKDLTSSSRIPRLDGISRIPLPGTMRHQQQEQITSANLPKILSTTKITRPNSFGGLKEPGISTMASIKKSLSGERFSEAANMMSRKTATVMKKFLTKPEKSEKNIEMKSHQDNKLNSTVILEKGSKECCNEKSYLVNDVQNTTSLTQKPSLTRSDTFVRDCNDTLSTAIQFDELSNNMIQSTPVCSNNLTKILDKSKEKWGITQDNINQSNSIMSPTKILNNNNTRIHQKHLIGSTPPSTTVLQSTSMNCTKFLDKSKISTKSKININNLTKTLNNSSLYQNIDKSTEDELIFNNTQIDENKLIRRSQCFGEISKLSVNEPNLLDSKSYEYLNNISIPQLDLDETIKPNMNKSNESLLDYHQIALTPNKKDMTLILNSTIHDERLLDITNDIVDESPSKLLPNNTKILYMSPLTQENYENFHFDKKKQQNQCNNGSSRNSLIRTPDDYIESMEVDDCDNVFEIPSNVQQVLSLKALQELKQTNKPRFSFGLDLTECTLDCSIELCDISLASNAPSIGTNNANNGNNSYNLPLTSPNSLKKQNSFELDESLGILTPDQMKEFLDSNTTNTNNLDLPLVLNNLPASGICNTNKLLINHQMRIDQTPSPEDLPLDPVGVKTDTDDIIMELPQLSQHQQSQNIQLQPQLSNSTTLTYTELSQTDTDSKTDQMTKSNVSKVSTSFITSVTSITSLDTGYQGDGEMSRPASRSGNACDHSPSNGPRNHHHKLHQIARQPSFNNQQQNIPIRRQDPMTDSDFFTESDADIDIFHRGDRRAQVIDGQLYGPSILQQPAASVFISEQPEMEDSCMDSSGIFTDIENRCDDDLATNRTIVIQSQDIDMSPDGSTDTVKSNTNQQLNKTDLTINDDPLHTQQNQVQLNQLTDSQTSSTINSSFSSNSISTDYNQPIQLKNKQQLNFTTPTIESLPNDTTIINQNQNLTTNTTNYQQQQQNHHDHHHQQQIKALANNTSNINVSAAIHSVKKFSPSRKHVGNNLSSRSSSGIIQAGLKYDIKKKLPSTTNNDVLTKNVNNTTFGIQRVNKKLRNSNDMINNKRLTTKNHNQENKSPSASDSNNSSSISFSTTNGLDDGGGGSSGSTTIVGKLNKSVPNVGIHKLSSNKWDAVMNKIAENKSLKLKKINYQQVKSKVSTGVLLLNGGKKSTSSSSIGNIGGKNIINNENSENIRKNQNKSEILYDNNSGNQSPIDNSKCSNSGLTSPQQKRLIQGAIKRGRSYSKDSQQSSQSDISLSGGSPKLLAKTPTRSAKKRDVRNLSISPTDLGPPPKTQTTTNTPNGITRTKNPTTIFSQKRASHSQQTNNTTTIHSINKVSSPPLKKSSVRRPLDQKSHTKTTLNDHNRLIGQQQNGNVKTNGIIANGAVGSGKSHPVASSTPVGSVKLRNGTTIHNHSLASPIEKKRNQQQIKTKHEIVKQSGSLELRIPPPSQPPDKTVEALGVLLHYLAYDLDAFSCPIIKNEFAQAQKHLLDTKIQLEDVKTTCHELQDQLQEKEHYYITREQELQALHRCELTKAEKTLVDCQTTAEGRIALVQSKISLNDTENKAKFKAYVQETELKFNQQDKELQLSKQRELELQQRINELTINENELRDKIQDAEDKFAERLQSAGQREKDLQEKLNLLNKQLDLMKKEADNKERDLEEKLHVTQDEVTVLRHSRNSLAAATNNATAKNENGSSNGGASKGQMLENEVESLRCVLEIKQNDIAELRKKNQEVIRENEELRAMQLKYSGIESRMEDLQIQLKTKDEENKELLVQLKQLKDACKQESKNRTRLSLHNEELQWKLKQNSEKYAATLTELSKSYQDKSGYIMSASKISFHSQDNANDTSNNSSLSNSQNRTNGSDRMGGCCFEMEDISPPSSPIVKGVVEKSDSVSWVLEMDDETTPEVLASRMVRRAGSFRSSFNEKYSLSGGNGANKRQLSLPMGSASPTMNPLQQSASANMIIPVRQHSSDINTCDSSTSIPKTRNRSNSVRGTESKNKLIRQNSVNSNASRKHDLQPTWKEPICSSSPYNRRISSRNSSPPSLQEQPSTSCSTKQISKSYTGTTDSEPNFFNSRKQSRHLITCDTSALTASERFVMQQRSSSIPSATTTHSSVQDLNVLKKFQEIQESAGEAMVSGTNSEDESCSASSDDSPSSTSNSSLGVGHHNNKQHMSIEEALLLNKMHNSLGGTPMEVSWSSDAEPFASESIV